MHESLSGRHGSGGRTGRADWHSRMFRTIYFVLTLATGMMVGIVVTLQLLSYLRITGAMFSPRNPGHGAPLVNRGMGDEELLWRASMAPRRPGLPIPRTPKVAFMFLTVGPLPLSPLWEKFFKGHEDQYSIYVHSLPGYEPDAAPSSVFFGRHITSQVCLLCTLVSRTFLQETCLQTQYNRQNCFTSTAHLEFSSYVHSSVSRLCKFACQEFRMKSFKYDLTSAYF